MITNVITNTSAGNGLAQFVPDSESRAEVKEVEPSSVAGQVKRGINPYATGAGD